MATLTVGTGKTYSTVQAAINAAVGGDTIAIDPGVYPESLTCPDKGVLGSSITLTSSASAANLPAVGVRTSPAYAAFMPTIQSAGVGAPAVQVEVGANHYTFRHIHFPEVPGGINQIISIGYADSTQQFESDEPTDITIDQCYIHGSATLGQKRAIHTAGKRIVISNNYFADIKSTGAGEGDSQCIAGWNGHGPLTVTNNYLSAGTEPFLLGGSDPSIRTFLTVSGSPTTTTATVTCSEASHTLAEIAVGQTIACLVGGVWKQTTLTSKSGNGASGTIGFTALSAAPDVGTNTIKAGCILDGLLFRYNHVRNDPTWINEAWAIKNLFELKACVNAQIDSNIFENCWPGADQGYAVWLKTVDQDGTAPYLQTKNIVFEKNIIRHCCGFLELHGIEAENGGRPGPLTNVTIRNNLVYDSGTDPWRQGGQTFAIVATEGVVNATIDHNTIVHVTTGTAGGALQLDDTVALLSGFVFTNNLVRGETYGIICSGGQGTAGLAAAAPGYVFSKNVLSNVPSGSYPANNTYPTDAAWQAGFTTYTVTGVGANYTLLPTCAWHNGGTDFRDVGADIDLVLRATASVLAGTSTVGTGRVRIKRATTAASRRVLRSTDIVYRGAIRMPNSSIDTTSTYGGMSGRIVGGQTHVFLYDSINASAPPNVWELDITGLTPSLDYTTAPRASVVRNWGQIYGSARASWTPSGALKDGCAANFNKIGHVCLHWHEPLQQLFWSFVDFYNVNGDPDWTVGMSTLNDSNGSSVGYGPYRFKATDRDGRTWYGHRSYFFFEHPTTGKMLTGGIAHSGDASVPFGPSCYGDADWPTPTTPGGHNAANDITLANRYLDYYCMNGSFAQSTGNYFNLNGSWNGVIRAFQFDGILTYPVEYFPTDYPQARVDPLLNGGKGTWQGAMCSMNDAFWFEGTHTRGVLYVGTLAAGYSTDGSDPTASHTWYRNVGLGHDTCMHGFSCVQCASAGDSSTKTIPSFIVMDPDRLTSNKAGDTLDYTTEAHQIIDAELTYNIRTCSQDKLQAKGLSGVWRVPNGTRFLVSANTADISRSGESFPETLLHVFDILDS